MPVLGKGQPEKKKEGEDVDSDHPEAKLLSCYYYVSIGLVKVIMETGWICLRLKENVGMNMVV